MRLDVESTRTTGEFDYLWWSTGFSPAKLLRHDDMRQTIAYLGAVPNDRISHVRIHFLLDLVRIGGDPPEGTPRYDWSKLDEGLDVLVENGLRPFFELMGNPSNVFDDFTDRDQLRPGGDSSATWATTSPRDTAPTRPSRGTSRAGTNRISASDGSSSPATRTRSVPTTTPARPDCVTRIRR